MEPKDETPETGEPKSAGPETSQPESDDVVETAASRAKIEQAGVAAAKPAEERPLRMEKPKHTRWKIGAAAVDSQIDEREFARMSRRDLLKVVPVLVMGAFAVPRFQRTLLKKGLAFSDWASARLFRHRHFAPTFTDSELTPFAKFPINGYDVDDPGVNLENWSLTVTGAVHKPGDYRLGQIQSLPRVRQNTRHVCVEGWDVIGRFGGARLSDFLDMVGADTSSRFLTVACADDYYESLDMATALHPQTLLCYEMYDQPLTRKHGAPLRLNIPTKVGYKQAKYLTGLNVTNVLDKVGYWEDQGYSSFYSL